MLKRLVFKTLPILLTFAFVILLLLKLFLPIGNITALLVKDYLQASYKLTGLLHVDVERTSYDNWQADLKLNQSDWQTIQYKAKFLSLWYKYFHLIPIISAQETEVSLKSHQLENQIKTIFNTAPPGKKIQKVMEYMQADAKTAQQAITKAYQIDAQTYKHKAKVYKELAKIAAQTKDASFILVNVGGVIITGGELFAAKQAALLALKSGTKIEAARQIASAAYNGLAVVFNGADAVLAVGEKGALIMDNRQLQSVMVDARNKIGPITTVLAITDFKSLKKGFKKGFAKEPTHWVTLEGYAQALANWLQNDPQHPPRMTVNISTQGTTITYNLNLQIQKYLTSPPSQIIFNQAPIFLPHGNYIILNQPLNVNKLQPAKSQTPSSNSSTPTPANNKPQSFLERYCEIAVEFEKLQNQGQNFVFKNVQDCLLKYQNKVNKVLKECPKASLQERQGIPCTKEAIQQQLEKTIKKDLLPLMQKYCQKECHQPSCSSPCSKVNNLLNQSLSAQ